MTSPVMPRKPLTLALLVAAANLLFATTAAAEQVKNGEAAIEQPGSQIDEVAAAHGTTAHELAEQLREDPSLHVDGSEDLLPRQGRCDGGHACGRRGTVPAVRHVRPS
jgi:hypothetical protein